MKKQILSIIIGTIVLAFLFGALQAQTVTLTFTGKDANNQYVQLNRVVITNLTKGWQETIYWPDTTLTMQNTTGIGESVANGGFDLSQNNPNPFTGTTDVNLTMADAGAVTLEIVDGNGKMVGTHRVRQEIGTHQFRISLSAAGTYVMTARQNGKTSSIKMVCNGGGNTNAIEYLGMVQNITFVLKSTTINPFNFGDMMEYVGYATINGTEYESARISQMQGASQTFAMVFDLYTDGLPMVSTLSVSNLTASSAEVSGIVLSDGGSTVTERGFCWDTLSQPTLSDASLQCGAGIGNFIGVISGLLAETTYYVRAYATNGEGTSYGAVFSFTTPDHTSGNGGGSGGSGGGSGSGDGGGTDHTYVEWDGEGLNPNDSYPCEGTPTLTDIDGNVYNTVQIGNQCWMKENLRTTRFANGNPLQFVINPTENQMNTLPLMHYPGRDSANVYIFGYLYSKVAARGTTASSNNLPSEIQGICPDGWHLPSTAEWNIMINYVRSQSCYKCQSEGGIAKSLASNISWDNYHGVNNNQFGSVCTPSIDILPNNATGFSALAAGCDGSGYFSNFGCAAYFWSTTDYTQQNPGEDGGIYIYHVYDDINYGGSALQSVRCLKD